MCNAAVETATRTMRFSPVLAKLFFFFFFGKRWSCGSGPHEASLPCHAPGATVVALALTLPASVDVLHQEGHVPCSSLVFSRNPRCSSRSLPPSRCAFLPTAPAPPRRRDSVRALSLACFRHLRLVQQPPQGCTEAVLSDVAFCKWLFTHPVVEVERCQCRFASSTLALHGE